MITTAKKFLKGSIAVKNAIQKSVKMFQPQKAFVSQKKSSAAHD